MKFEMKYLVVIISMLLLISVTSFGQGIVRGKVTDENGETVIGASIILKTNPSVGTTTDFDGNYSLKIAKLTPEILVISYISYASQEFTVNPVNGQVVIKNISLVSSSQKIGEVEIVAKMSREKDNYMEKVKMKSATSIDYISSETIKKTGDSYVVSALARVSGVSTSSSGIITVRGISDRYVKTTLNGASIPTLDPFTNNLKLDIFPTSLIDNVTVTKTFQPDQPADWAGAYISIVTKDYPESLSVTAETSIGYNSQSTFKSFLTSETSSTDWMGYDKDFRDIDHGSYQQVNRYPTQYEELVALGLGPYYQSLGITSWTPSDASGVVYFKLGLIQLGLLGAAQINDPAAYSAAVSAYSSGDFKNEAFYQINEKPTQTSRELPNNWNTFHQSAPLDFSQSIQIGNQIELFSRPLGILAGFRYASQYRNDPNGKNNRVFGGDVVGILSESNEEQGIESHGWSGLLNLNYKLNSNNSLGILFMPNQLGINKVRDGAEQGSNPNYEYTLTKDQYYEQRTQLIYQVKSEHYIPALKSKIEFNASYTDGTSKAPDFKTLTYFEEGDQYLIDTKESTTHRYYRYLEENILDTRLSFEVPVGAKPGLSRNLKIGGSYLKSDRESEQYDYKVNYFGGGFINIPNNDIGEFFDVNTFSLQQDSSGQYVIDKFYVRDDNPANHIVGYRETIGGFAMLDYNISFSLRVVGGLRVEKALLFTDVYDYDKLGYKNNDPRRKYSEDIFVVNSGNLNEVSFLPSVGIIYNITANTDAPFNLRANYSKSVARPSIRELSDAIVYDYEVKDDLFGNSNLKEVKINNYDLRLERYFNSGTNLSGSVFYKDFKNHIELISTVQGFTWQNVDESFAYGIEVEGSGKITKNLELQANFTLVKSETNFIQYQLLSRDGIKEYIPVDTLKHNMYGQAPYVVNTILTYGFDSLGLSISASYNLQGRKLVITSTTGTPDVYDMPRHLVDLKVSKRIGKYFSASFKIQNLLDEPVRRTYIYDDGGEIDYDRFSYGTTYTLGLTYKLSK
ncbi:MAG: TonB-dependent receptor [Bacteroidetes bacterium]|nr:TonB-dependent receptor [Bacteroidota bacterium]